MTTNGYRLAQRVGEWREVGISAINISVDSLDPARFATVTGHDRLAEVLRGVETMTDFVVAHDLSLRFIEVMRTNDNAAFFSSSAI